MTDVHHELSDERTPLLSTARDNRTDALSARNQNFKLYVSVMLAAFVVVINFGEIIQLAPQTRVMESIYCREYYKEVDPSLIDEHGNVPERYCKIDPVQSNVAYLIGGVWFFQFLPGLFLALPYGALADKYGRKWILALNAIVAFLQNIAVYIILAYPHIFPLQLIWLVSVGAVFGGGNVVITALVFAIIADVFTEAERTNVFFWLVSAYLLPDVFAPFLSSFLMRWSPWLPMSIGVASYMIPVIIAIMLPETLSILEEKLGHTKHMLNEIQGDDTPAEDSNEEHNTWTHWARRGLNWIYDSVYFAFTDLRVAFLLGAFVIYTQGLISIRMVLQYISTRYHWTYAQAQVLRSVQATIKIVVNLAVLPPLSKWLMEKRNLSSKSKDLYMARACFICYCLSWFVEAIAPNVIIATLGLAIYALGNAGSALIRSLATSLVEPHHIGRLYGLISIMESIGLMLWGPWLAFLFHAGMKMGGGWIGLPYLISSLFYGIAVLGLFFLRLRPGEVGDRDRGDEEGRGEVSSSSPATSTTIVVEQQQHIS
ncbi:MAG: hypothetical protein M1834_005862 [Cirrosporium novae-zelandiae]|nr:MAG: hypothetical protein M1834_005862 [Cirrosporium novae-zelandiae]